jgi:hypothetical protein
MRALRDLRPGERFGSLTVQGRIANTTNITYSCLCDCGYTTNVLKTDLLRTDGRQITACKMCRGRKSHNRAVDRTGFNGAVNKLYYIYKRSAEERGRLFDLTLQEFYYLSQRNCVYCGRAPSQEINNGDTTYTTLLYNGIDRVDNTQGYNMSNCVTCCRKCNFAKRDMSYEDFMSWIMDITLYNKDRI